MHVVHIFLSKLMYNICPYWNNKRKGSGMRWSLRRSLFLKFSASTFREIRFVAAVSRWKLEIRAFWFMTSCVQSIGRDSELGGSKVLWEVILLCLMSQRTLIFVSAALITSNLALQKRIHLITEICSSCRPKFAMYDENVVGVELYFISVSYSITAELPESIFHFLARWHINSSALNCPYPWVGAWQVSCFNETRIILGTGSFKQNARVVEVSKFVTRSLSAICWGSSKLLMYSTGINRQSFWSKFHLIPIFRSRITGKKRPERSMWVTLYLSKTTDEICEFPQLYVVVYTKIS